MKKLHFSFLPVLGALAALLLVSNADAAPFTPGNLAVLRLSNGGAALSGAGTPVFIDEYTTAGAPVQTISVPPGGVNALVMSGTSTSDGALMRSPDGKFLCFAGYNAPVGTLAIAGTTALAVPREVAVLDVNGVYAVPASTTTQFSGTNPRSGATDGVNNYWASGGNSGTYYYGLTAPSVTVQITRANTRVNNIQNGNLLFTVSTATAGASGIYGFTAGGTPTVLSDPPVLIIPTTAGVGTPSPYAFAINPAGTLAYVADDRTAASGGGVQRWNKIGGVWTLAYTHTVGTVGARGLVVDWSGGGSPGNPIIYATTTEANANRLVKIIDGGGASPAVTLVTLPAAQVFRGVAFAPAMQMANPPVQVYPTPQLPPPDGVYVSPTDWHAIFAATGIAISNVSHRHFMDRNPNPQPLPGPGQDIIHEFSSIVEVEMHNTLNPGSPVIPVSAPAQVVVRVTGTPDPTVFQTEMLQLDIAGGTLPPGVMIRESPTLQSTGQTTVQPVGTKFAIGSFFDIFVEMSMDGGQNWVPAGQPGHVELRRDPTTVPPIPAPTPILPPPNDKYVSPADYHLALAQGIIISNVSHRLFTDSQPPPPPNGPPTVHNFDSQVDMQLSTDGGATFRPARVPASVAVGVRHRQSLPDGTQVYDTEMLSLNLQGGDLPPGMLIRESPTKASTGGTSIAPNPDGSGTFRIGSFFDIFTEVSLDNGQNWIPVATPGHVELQCNAPEIVEPSPNLPPLDGEYVSPADFHAALAMGIVISNISHNKFTQSQPPPPAGGSQVHTFSSAVDMDVQQAPGQPFQRISVPAIASVRVDSTTHDFGDTRYFDTEMLQLDIAGAGLPPGVMIRESPTRASLGRTSVRMVTDPQGQIWDYISSFFDIFTEISLDGGQNWQPAANGPAEVNLRKLPLFPPVVIVCPGDISAVATTLAGAVVTYTPTVSGGCDPVMPPMFICNPPSGSTFPVGITTVGCTAFDLCNQSATCTFKITVTPQPPKEVFFNTNNLPPLDGMYISPAQYHQLYANGIIIRNIRHNRFLQSFPPPPSGGSEIHTFGSEVAGEISMDGGATFTPLVTMGNADVTVRITHTGTAGGTSSFDTEMLSLTLMTTNGLKLRESPSKASTGQTTVRPVPGGYMLSSFFDVFTELSLDNGAMWSPAADPGHVELRKDPTLVKPIPAPSNLLPPPNDRYISPALFHALFAQGIVIKDVRHSFFTQSLLPPVPGSSQVHSFSSQVDFLMSQNGSPFLPGRATGAVQVRMDNLGSSANDGLFDTEMLQLDISGGDLPAGVILRESPTLPSRGGTSLAAQSDGTYRIHSFFDIFVDLSVDGGQNWSPSQSGPAHVELVCNSPEQVTTTPALPPPNGQYVSPDQWHAAFANGVIISNASHNRFLGNQPPPPPPGATNTHFFNSTVTMMVSLNNGQTWAPASASAMVTTMVASATYDLPPTTQNLRYFNTEMLGLSIGGGSLPTGVMVRESPTRASLGRTSRRAVSTGPGAGTFRLGSFFDIFTELSMDGGQTWSPSLTLPPSMALSTPPLLVNVGLQIAPPAVGSTSAMLTWTGAGCRLQCTEELKPVSSQTVWQDVADQSPYMAPILPGKTRFYRVVCP